jgi:hypothetical protein
MSEERIAKLEAQNAKLEAQNAKFEGQIESLKKVISTVGENAQKSVTDVREELGRVNRVQIDRATKVEGIALESGDKISALEKMIVGDGDQEPGIRAELKEVRADTSELKLDKRDRETSTKTRTGLLTAVWSFGGAITLGVIVSTFKGIVDEKAQNALRVQNENRQEFVSIKDKIEKSNQIFYSRTDDLNQHKARVETDLKWIIPRLK